MGCVRPDRRLQQGGLPVSSAPPERPVRFCCSRVVPHAPARAPEAPRLGTVATPDRDSAPAFAGHPALCCPDFPLTLARQRPSCQTPRTALSMRRVTSCVGGVREGQRLTGAEGGI